jgi:hypothetical protein
MEDVIDVVRMVMMDLSAVVQLDTFSMSRISARVSILTNV